MTRDSNFIALEKKEKVEVSFDGKKIQLSDGDNLASALLQAGIYVFRNTHKTGSARAPYCMMGSCFECLVEIDGETKQACQEVVTKGMRIKRGGKIG